MSEHQDHRIVRSYHSIDRKRAECPLSLRGEPHLACTLGAANCCSCRRKNRQSRLVAVVPMLPGLEA